ncbi:glycosyltransferase family 32 protein [Bacillus sp. FJAT-28004]|uniref:glycosyltransferase family 32 protein n=1 Tax=Bacillus sp. FJAT-28004 TaxID=1679165 RepID=UPI0006B5878D|nr:glycosyltransferase [Bacillus sp. FJAT-28004]
MGTTDQIPRILHYCWFGRGEKSNKIQKCMDSWKRHLSEYTIIEWNEDNFDIYSKRYVKEAYLAGKFAFVSDYVRLHALYHHGGIYLDTDVEVLKPLDSFLHHEAFSGFEDQTYLQSATMGAVKGHSWMRELLENYDSRSFLQPDGIYDLTTNTTVITDLCKKHGLILNGEYQVLANGVTFYPRAFFSPYDYINGGNYITVNSFTIHHFAKSWLPLHVRVNSKLKRIASRVVGPTVISKIRKLLSPN